MGQNQHRTPSEHQPIPLKWVVHLSQYGTIGFDPQRNVFKSPPGVSLTLQTCGHDPFLFGDPIGEHPSSHQHGTAGWVKNRDRTP